jgi:hypothetical protein
MIVVFHHPAEAFDIRTDNVTDFGGGVSFGETKFAFIISLLPSWFPKANTVFFDETLFFLIRDVNFLSLCAKKILPFPTIASFQI